MRRVGWAIVAAACAVAGCRAKTFQRGWEKLYRSPNGATVAVAVFEFAAAGAPDELSSAFSAGRPPGFHQQAVPTVPDATAQIGTSPQGLTTALTVYPLGRLLVTVLVGGPKDVYDYGARLTEFARAQLDRLP